MLHKVAGLRDFGRKVSPPQPTFMTDEQKSDYLSSLRNNRPSRPGGSRPAPFKSATYTASQSSLREEPIQESSGQRDVPNAVRSETEIVNKRSSTYSTSSRFNAGRPLAQAPPSVPSVRGRKVSPTATVVTTSAPDSEVYQESGTRWLERQEAHSLREALRVMDAQNEEQRIHEAARDEAAELVWKHRNPKAAEEEKSAAYRNPDLSMKNRLNSHLERGAQRRSLSGRGKGIPKSNSSRTVSDSSVYSQSSNEGVNETSDVKVNISMDSMSNTLGDLQITRSKTPKSPFNLRGKDRRRSSGQRNVSNGSSKGIFRNPEDEIYEEPETLDGSAVNGALDSKVDTTGPLKSRPRNSLPRGGRPLPEKSSSTPVSAKPKLDPFEIYRNPPTQSRNAAYTVNLPISPPAIEVIPEVDTAPSSGEMEIRGEDIRAATSMKRSDRSPKLPTPTAVSDRLGRPIVSFDPGWRPSQESANIRSEPEMSRPSPNIPIMTVSAPAVPTIQLPDDEAPSRSLPTTIHPTDNDLPTIQVSGATDGPAINVPGQPPQFPPSRPRPVPRHTQTSPPKLSSNTSKLQSRLPWLNPVSRGGVPSATCANCFLPISGRVVTASGASPSSSKARFHPECFTCHHCSTSLECIAFYPEPDTRRDERHVAAGIVSADEAATDPLRFYCHLDFHEFFSPRCRSCKTPIENGEVIVAAGAEWHVGHFFCAECGDPFDQHTPFVERDGYAYCVRCHTRRTSTRCRGCKQPILDEIKVEALGASWHESCFVCVECGGDFVGGGGGREKQQQQQNDGDDVAEAGGEVRFFVREVEVEMTEKERRRGLFGSGAKVEERAVCEGCEGRRLKA